MKRIDPNTLDLELDEGTGIPIADGDLAPRALTRKEERSVKKITTKESRFKLDKKRWYGQGTYHSTDDIKPWRRAEMIMKEFTGKQFSKAFSKFCAAVPEYQHGIFLDRIDESKESSVRRWRQNDYYVDSVGNIQKRKKDKVKKPITFQSSDYKCEYRHKTGGHKLPELDYWNFKRYFPGTKSLSEAKSIQLKDYQLVVVSGFEKTFKTKQDPEFKRLMAEKVKANRVINRKLKKENESKNYILTHVTDEMKMEAARQNRLKILKKGFDPENSFHAEPTE